MQHSYIDTTDGWRRRFALIPFRLDNGPHRTWVWLEWYQSRFMGEYVDVRLNRATERNRALEDAASHLEREAKAIIAGADQFDQGGDIYSKAGWMLECAKTVRNLKQ